MARFHSDYETSASSIIFSGILNTGTTKRVIRLICSPSEKCNNRFFLISLHINHSIRVKQFIFKIISDILHCQYINNYKINKLNHFAECGSSSANLAQRSIQRILLTLVPLESSVGTSQVSKDYPTKMKPTDHYNAGKR